MAPNMTGISFNDHLRSVDLVNAVLDFEQKYLRSRGHLVAKILSGAHEKGIFYLSILFANKDSEIFKRMEDAFTRVYRVKPEASRRTSSELFLVGVGKK